MKHQWLAYLVVGLLSIGAGVAIAGLPDNSSAGATVSPTTTLAPDTTAQEATSAPTTETASTEAPTTVSDTTVAETTTTPTTVPTTTEPDTTDSVPVGLPDRSELFTIVANGANVSGAAGRNVELLRAIGYTDIAARNGTTIVEFTTVHFADGFEDAARRLAEDLDLLPFYVAPIEVMPTVLDLPADVELVVYIGLDRA